MADEFSLGRYPQSSLLVVYSERNAIELDPEYQRISGIWTREKRQLLIDSLLNGFDVPKLYFHEFIPSKQKGGKKYRYAIVDVKQFGTSSTERCRSPRTSSICGTTPFKPGALIIQV